MRPLELELTGFRSYDAAVVDWRPHRLVVIEGATGSGKSSLLDAICFALYGQTAESKSTRDLLTLGRAHGEVRMTFSLGEDVWRVTRRLGTKAPDPRHILERLTADGGSPTETIGTEAAVNQRLRELLGMSFSAFTSAVVLAQGRFAQFLQAKPGERDDILRELFGIASLDGAREQAREAHAAATGRAHALSEQRAMLDDHRQRVRAGIARRLRAAGARRAGLQALLHPARRADQAQKAHDGWRERVDELRAAMAGLPSQSSLGELAEQVARHTTAVHQAEVAVRAAQTEHRAAVDRRDALRTRHGGTATELTALRGAAERVEALVASRTERVERYRSLREERARITHLVAPREGLVAHRQALAQRDEAHDHLRLAEAQAAAAQQELNTVSRADAEAAAAAQRANAERDRAQHRHLAANLRRELEPGDPCPVCGGTVGDHAAAAPDLERAVAAARQADSDRRTSGERRARAQALAEERRGGVDQAQRLLAEAQARVAAAADGNDATLAQLDGQIDQLDRLHRDGLSLDAQITAITREGRSEAQEQERLRARLGRWIEAEAVTEQLGAAIAETAAAEDRATATERAVAAARQGHAAAQTALSDLAQRELGRVRTAAAVAAHRIGVAGPAPDADATELMAAMADLDRAGRAAIAHAEGAAVAAKTRAEHAAATYRRAAQTMGSPPPQALADGIRSCEQAREATRRELAGVEETARQAREMAHRQRLAERDAECQARVVRDLEVDRFPRYLLARVLDRLAEGASERLHALSGEAYRFSHESARRPLDVIDLARGGRVRPAATLSGGERFLASLALALSLADVAAGAGGRLDCLFLDEGFSTLDAESLEQAMAGVERLADDGRLVGVITHLPGVAERLGASIRVRKDRLSGVSTVIS